MYKVNCGRKGGGVEQGAVMAKDHWGNCKMFSSYVTVAYMLPALFDRLMVFCFSASGSSLMHVVLTPPSQNHQILSQPSSKQTSCRQSGTEISSRTRSAVDQEGWSQRWMRFYGTTSLFALPRKVWAEVIFT